MQTMLRTVLTTSLLLLAAVSMSEAAKDCSGFKPGAQDHVTVRYKEQVKRGGKVKTVVTEAEITWRPQDMLSDLACFDLSQTALLYRSAAEAEYKTADVDQRPAGAAAKWTIDIKPCLTYRFAIKVVGETENIFELPTALGPASADDIVDSGFTPDAPTGFSADAGATMATLKWARSDCANSYYVTYREAGGAGEARFASTKADATSVQIKDLTPCTNYEVTVSAYLSEESEQSGDMVVNFATKPRLDAAKDMKVDVKTTIDSAVVTMEVWSASCVAEYEMTVCDSDRKCKPVSLVARAAGLPTITHTVSGLAPCTDYTLEIQPVFTNTAIEKRVVSFRTLSPESAALKVGQVVTESVSSGSMLISWPSVKCASAYKVYQKETQEDAWKQVADTSEQEITVGNVTPCTQYHFAISAVLDAGKETEKSVGPHVMSALEEDQPFEAPNLAVDNADTHADVTWEHADCIESYILKLCQAAYSDCKENTIEPKGRKSITFRLEELEPCTQYSLQVIPVITGRTFTAKTNQFTTTNGTPQAPADFKAALQAGGKAKLSWSGVQCATGYKVFRRAEEGAKETTRDVTALEDVYADQAPCAAYEYAVATLVDEQLSEKTEWASLLEPPRQEEPPMLKILNNESDNITLRLDLARVNAKCKVEEYELSYSADGSEPFDTKLVRAGEDKADADLVLSFPGASGAHSIVQARVKYAGTDVWSEAASSREPGDHSRISQVPTDAATTLVPIVVGVVLALVIVVLAVIYFVRRRRAGRRYDAEKAENGKPQGPEETQKLNENHPDV